jgi:hypothetical protein
MLLRRKKNRKVKHMPRYEVVDREYFYRDVTFYVDADDPDDAHDMVTGDAAGPANEYSEYEWEHSEIESVRLMEDEDEG